jgi:hypothetical protein
MVTSKTAGKPIMVERAMYWNNRGAGTDTIGGYSDYIPPTPTPTPTPTGTIDIVSKNGIINSIGDAWVYAVVQNNTGKSVCYVKITAGGYDSNGNLLTTDYGYADIDVMDNGDKSGVSMVFDTTPSNMTQYKLLTAEYMDSDVSRNRDVVVTSSNGYSDYDWYNLDGTVHNNSSTHSHQYTQLSVAYYDSSGALASTWFVYTDGDIIPPGGSDTFSDMQDETEVGPINSHEIWVNCQYGYGAGRGASRPTATQQITDNLGRFK